MSARGWDVRRKSPFRGFFDGLSGAFHNVPLFCANLFKVVEIFTEMW